MYIMYSNHGMPNLLSDASSDSTRILNLIPAEKECARLFENLRKGIMNSDELDLQNVYEVQRQ